MLNFNLPKSHAFFEYAGYEFENLITLKRNNMKIHFIAIGGSAMHNLALALHDKGEIVTGSDDAIFEPSRSRLAAKGLLPQKMGWFPEKITTDLDAIVLGMHAKADNPELLKAKELGIKIYSYPEFIFQQSQNKTRVVIGGSHGKTTITSMILHVMNYHGVAVDYLVGAQLPGFDNMVKLTHENEFIVIEGDEYLSSALDLRPKFHLYQPNIALISGIAWDHINVFPTFENYKEQFAIFIDKIINGGILVYNSDDTEVKDLVENTDKPIRKMPYQLPEYSIENGQTLLHTPDGEMPIEVFGEHNLSNLAGAKWICQNMGIDEADFYEAIATFTGAAKRLEKIGENTHSVIFKDFAHSPSKVTATVQAVKAQYPNKKVIACLELHTYSSLNPEFISQYKGALDKADLPIVFFHDETVKIKKLKPMSAEKIYQAFGRNDLKVFTSPTPLYDFLNSQKGENIVWLFMSSGNYGGIDWKDLEKMIE